MREEWKELKAFLEKDPEKLLREELHADKIVDEVKAKGGKVAWTVKQEGALPRPSFDLQLPGEYGAAFMDTSWDEYVQILRKNYKDDLAVSTDEDQRHLLQQALICICYLEAAETNKDLTDIGPAAYALGQLAQQNREYLDSSKTLARGVKNYHATSSGGKADDNRRVDHEARVKMVEEYLKRNPKHTISNACQNVASNNPELGSANAIRKSLYADESAMARIRKLCPK